MKLAENSQAYAIMGCAMRVHATLGGGFLESAYGDALEIEFAKSGVPFVREDEISIVYQGHPLKTTYRADFSCFGRSFLVELKAVKEITGVEKAQVVHYMKATGVKHALLINFANEKLQYETFDTETLKRASTLSRNSDSSDGSANAPLFQEFENRSVSGGVGKIGVSNRSKHLPSFSFDRHLS